jgi:hypothetical protein
MSNTGSRLWPSELVDAFVAGSERLVATLREVDGATPVWTWAPAQQDVAFVTRHQVQEAAVHHFDAVLAAGGRLVIEAPVAADAVEEYMTFSVSTDQDPAEPARPSLRGRFTLACTDIDARWSLADGARPGTVAMVGGAGDDRSGGGPVLQASASDLLLWLYQRVELEPVEVPEDLVARFRALCFTD